MGQTHRQLLWSSPDREGAVGSYAGTDTEIKFLNISKSDECEWIWDLYGDQIQPLASHMPYMTGVGNHEV